MSYEEFQQLARIFVVGTLDEEEMIQFQTGRMEFGQKAEAFIVECRRLNSVFALSLNPMAPASGTKEKLLARIRNAPPRPGSRDSAQSGPEEIRASKLPVSMRFFGRN